MDELKGSVGVSPADVSRFELRFRETPDRAKRPPQFARSISPTAI
jgi:hypothetical protein